MRINFHSYKMPAWIIFIMLSVFFFISLVGCVFDSKMEFFWAPFMIIFGMGAIRIGYRVFFFSENWFRAKEEQKAIWWSKHPFLYKTANILGWSLIACIFLGEIIRHTFQKY